MMATSDTTYLQPQLLKNNLEADNVALCTLATDVSDLGGDADERLRVYSDGCGRIYYAGKFTVDTGAVDMTLFTVPDGYQIPNYMNYLVSVERGSTIVPEAVVFETSTVRASGTPTDGDIYHFYGIMGLQNP